MGRDHLPAPLRFEVSAYHPFALDKRTGPRLLGIPNWRRVHPRLAAMHRRNPRITPHLKGMYNDFQ